MRPDFDLKHRLGNHNPANPRKVWKKEKKKKDNSKVHSGVFLTQLQGTRREWQRDRGLPRVDLCVVVGERRQEAEAGGQ